jgi:hypothetical protein
MVEDAEVTESIPNNDTSLVATVQPPVIVEAEPKYYKGDYWCLICDSELHLLPTPLLCCGKYVCNECFRSNRFGENCPGKKTLAYHPHHVNTV